MENTKSAEPPHRWPHRAVYFVAALVLISGYLFCFGYERVLVDGKIWVQNPRSWPFRPFVGLSIATTDFFAFAAIVLLAALSAAAVVEGWIRGGLRWRSVAGFGLAVLLIGGLLASVAITRPEHPWADALRSPQYFPFIAGAGCLVFTTVRGVARFLAAVADFLRGTKSGRP
jgi:hypothetical protein